MDKLTKIVKKAISYGIHTSITEGPAYTQGSVQGQAEAVADKIEKKVIQPRKKAVIDEAVKIVKNERMDRVEAKQEIRSLLEGLGY